MRAPVLRYLTVFRSRLGSLLLVINLAGERHQSGQALLRRTVSKLEDRKDVRVNDPRVAYVFEYLTEKNLIGANARKSGRYRRLRLTRDSDAWVVTEAGEPRDTVSIYATDIALADPRVPSTVGGPTVDNAEEIVEFASQTRLLTQAKNTWTSRARLLLGVRQWGDAEAVENPFLLGPERTVLLAQILRVDGAMIREVLREVVQLGQSVARDDIAARLPGIVDRAVESVRSLRIPPPEMRQLREMQTTVRDTGQKYEARKTGTRSRQSSTSGHGPGVLEHRTAPRLEWLVDLGYLSKSGLARNGFKYHVTDRAASLLGDLDAWFGEEDWADEVACSQWRLNADWAVESGVERRLGITPAIRKGYDLMQRRIGPAPLGEVAFVVAMVGKGVSSYRAAVDATVQYAQATPGASLSGGRFGRAPENIFVPESVLKSE